MFLYFNFDAVVYLVLFRCVCTIYFILVYDAHNQQTLFVDALNRCLFISVYIFMFVCDKWLKRMPFSAYQFQLQCAFAKQAKTNWPLNRYSLVLCLCIWRKWLCRQHKSVFQSNFIAKHQQRLRRTGTNNRMNVHNFTESWDTTMNTHTLHVRNGYIYRKYKKTAPHTNSINNIIFLYQMIIIKLEVIICFCRSN